MSIELHVLSDQRLGSIAEWQRAIDAEGFSLRLSTEGEFDALHGHLPAVWGDRAAGFECDHLDAAAFFDEMPDLDFGRRWRHVLAFRLGGDFRALMGAYMAAAAYARATGGVVFDDESGEVMSADKAAHVARTVESDLPRLESGS